METIPDWITAISTALTAMFAGVTGLVAYVALRRDAESPLPIFEADFHLKDDAVTLKLTIRNLSFETMVVESLTVKRPTGMTIDRYERDPYGGQSPVKTDDFSRRVEFQIEPAGSFSRFAGHERSSDVLHRWLHFHVPAGWNGGSIVLEFLVSGKAHVARAKKVVVKRHIPSRETSET